MVNRLVNNVIHIKFNGWSAVNNFYFRPISYSYYFIHHLFWWIYLTQNDELLTTYLYTIYVQTKNDGVSNVIYPTMTIDY